MNDLIQGGHCLAQLVLARKIVGVIGGVGGLQMLSFEPLTFIFLELPPELMTGQGPGFGRSFPVCTSCYLRFTFQMNDADMCMRHHIRFAPSLTF